MKSACIGTCTSSTNGQPVMSTAPGDDEDDESGSEVEDAEEEEGETDIDDDEINVFPKAKTIVSDITGQPKRVYPEIEPDYDSDSSTEDVQSACSTCYELH